jgi:catechol 2,3-dioxygenase-like lactoylglutathione lyase family enzyme
MDVRGISWVGTRTDRFEATVGFFERTLGLRRAHDDPGMVAFRLPNGDTVEVFGPEDHEHGHFTTGPVVGFEVDDIEDGARELEAAGIELLSGVEEAGGYTWVHFRGPDGNVYELSRSPS